MSSILSSALGSITARDAVHAPVVAVDPSADLAQVAGLMGRHRNHGVLVEGIAGDRLVWGVVSDRDILRAALADDPALTAGDIAATEALTVDADDDLEIVCGDLAEHDCCTHAVVVEGGRPVGVVSTLDVASAIGN